MSAGLRKIIPMKKAIGTYIPYSRVHAWRLIKAGKLPAPVNIGSCPKGGLPAQGFYEDELIAWQKSLKRADYAPKAGA